MHDTLNKFLNSISFPIEMNKHLENASVIKAISFKKQQLLKVFILVPQVLDVRAFNCLMDSKNNYPEGKVEIVLEIENKKTINELAVRVYFTNFIMKKYENTAALEGLKKIKVSLNDEKIIIPVNTDIQASLFESINDELQAYFHNAGFNYALEIQKNAVDEDELLNRINAKKIQRIEESALKALAYDNEMQKYENATTLTNQSKFKKTYDKVTLHELRDDDQLVQIEGEVFYIEVQPVRNNKNIYTFYITDSTDSLEIKVFEGKRFSKEELENIKKGSTIQVNGGMIYDTYRNSYVFDPQKIKILDTSNEKGRLDTAPEKRVELHLHTKMSTMDAVGDIKAYVNQAVKWGHKALAVTDHGNIHIFPNAQAAIPKGSDFKIIYGSEAYMIDDKLVHAINPTDIDLEHAEYTILDFETTGLSARYDEIIEFGAIKISGGVEVERFQTFIKPTKPLSAFTTELTGIKELDVRNAPTLREIMPRILKFIGNSIIVAHNAVFDYGFLNACVVKLGGEKLTNPVIDTLPLARVVFPNLKAYTLGSVCRACNTDYDEDAAHRADYDAKVLSDAYLAMLGVLVEKYNINNHKDLNSLQSDTYYKHARPKHATLLVKNKEGLKNLYKIISESHTKYISDVARTPRDVINQYRDGLLVGSACFNGELFDIASTKVEEELIAAMSFYDYIEIQPIENYTWLVDTRRAESLDKVKQVIKDIVDAANKAGKIVVATGDVHYLNPEDKIYRDVYITAKSIGNGRHPLYDYRRRVKNNPEQHFRTTNEMLDSLSFLGADVAYEAVVTNTNKIADQIEVVKPIVDYLSTPKIDNAPEMLTELCYKNAREIYGDPLPEIVVKRLEKELKSIIGNGFAVIYWIAYLLVNKSLNDGYLVGSRGSVGSSFVATMAGITEVNPLTPHYVCRKCKHSEFLPEGTIPSGFDLPTKLCPECGEVMEGNGQNIPFETFLGFKGDKVPDIDLNFSGEYQPVAHNFTKEVLGEKNVFRAGTILTVAEKTAIGYAKGYFEDKGIENFRQAELKRLAMGCEGVKRTTGQHAGGIIVIPSYMDVFDVTPIQYPADEPEASWMTSHYDFHAIHDEILKLDILGHVDPTALRMLKDITGIDPKGLPMNDPQVMALFSGPEVMGVTKDDVLNEIGSAGVPEFGTNFVKGLLRETKPSKFSELVQISGLSHGTDVWNNNAQELIKKGICKLDEVIGCRDDIMSYLMEKGVPAQDSFKIMESVRKGKGLSEDWKKLMRDNNVPEWYIDSCLKIKYMFPKAHAAAYVMMALRVAWYKIHKPLHYYATFFTTRCDAYDIVTMVEGKNAIRNRILTIKDKIKMHEPVSNKENALLDTFDVALEMTARGYVFANIDINRSEASKFVVDEENNALIPPFTSVDGLGLSVAESIVKARNEKPFISIEDVENRTSLSKTLIQEFKKMGVFQDMVEENQLGFDLLFD